MLYNGLRRQRTVTADLQQQVSASADIEEVRHENERLWEELETMRQTIEDLRNDLEQKEEENEELKEELSEVVKTMEGNEYTPEFRQLCYNMLDSNVPQVRLNAVITDCLALVKKKASHLPNEKTIGKMEIERLALAQKQIGVRDADMQVDCF